MAVHDYTPKLSCNASEMKSPVFCVSETFIIVFGILLIVIVVTLFVHVMVLPVPIASVYAPVPCVRCTVSSRSK